MGSTVHLKDFSSRELFLSISDTRIVLKFVFAKADHPVIDGLSVTNSVRSFAQGLLLEAINASYSIGMVESLFRASANPTSGAKTVIRKFASGAAKRWLSHQVDPSNVEIYEFVRAELARKFRSELMIIATTAARDINLPITRQVSYSTSAKPALVAWS